MTRHYEYSESVSKGSIIIPLTATSLKSTNCEVRYANGVFEGLRANEDNDVLRVGKAVHKYAEVVNGCDLINIDQPIAAALAELGPEFAQCKSEVITACAACPTLPKAFATPRGPSKELSFALPWRRYFHEGRTYHVVLCGTMDLLTLGHSDIINIVDFKTTRYAKIEHAEAKYAAESQFTYYQWILRNFGHRVLHWTEANLARDYKLCATPYFVQLARGGARWIWGKPRSMTIAVERLFDHQIEHTLDTFILPLWFNERPPSRTGWLSNACAQCDFSSICFEEDEGMKNTTLTNKFKTELFGERYQALIEYV